MRDEGCAEFEDGESFGWKLLGSWKAPILDG